MIPILTGLAAGGLHVFSGVDHLAALAPLAVEDPSKAGQTGTEWITRLTYSSGVLAIVVGVFWIFRSRPF